MPGSSELQNTTGLFIVMLGSSWSVWECKACREAMAFAKFIMLLKKYGARIDGKLPVVSGLYPDSSGGPAFKAEWCQLKWDGL